MESGKKAAVAAGSQTLMRGLDVVEAVAAGISTVAAIADSLGLTRSTVHRLAASLVERDYLVFTPRSGYRLGAKLLELGHAAREQVSLIHISRQHLEALADTTDDTVHLGVLSDDQALYLDKVPGRRRITISSRVGDRQPLTSTGLGKALILDRDADYWEERLAAERNGGGPTWLERMAGYAAAGRAFDLEENEDRIRCVAAPVHDAGRRIVAAVSVSSAAQYMDDARMAALSDVVIDTANAISRELGWSG